jgi:Cft2 family RNA processing exonuclease
MFCWDNGLRLLRADLAVDFRRRQPRAFVSHAHSDHIARHEYALCTPETAALYQLRLGKRPTLAMPYRQPIEWGGLRLTTYPAGHCLGSAMLLAEDGDHSLLYTGDFKLGPSATSEQAELPHAESLVIESTYGQPQYRMPPHNVVVEQLFELVAKLLGEGAIPVVEAYTLGKSQEVIKLLGLAGFRVLQHPDIARVSEVYEACGMPLGAQGLVGETDPEGHVLVVPPRARRHRDSDRHVRIAVTGWAIDPRTKYRLGVDHAVPLSDHADYDELFEAVRRVEPKVVYCTHGPESFVDRLVEAGFDARPLGKPNQKRLF